MRELPTGTVTFLFTDIEGSTRLLQDARRAILRRSQDDHAAIMRTAIAHGDGVEVRTEGDSFFAVFATAERRHQRRRARPAGAGRARAGRRAGR